MPAAQPIIVRGGGSDPLKMVFGIGVTIVLGLSAWEARKWWKQHQQSQQLIKDQASTITVKPGKKLFDITGRPIKSANLATIAADLKDKIKFPTDDPGVVRVFQTTPHGYVGALEKLYLEKYGVNLKDELISNLNDTAWIKIKYNFR